MTVDIDPSVEIFVRAALGRKALGLVALDVRELTSVADVFIICSGRSNRQVTAIAAFIEKELRKQNHRPLSVEGKKEGHWVLIDYGFVVIHVFYEPLRSFYDLEGLWSDAPRLHFQGIRMAASSDGDPKGQDDAIIEEFID